MAEKIYKLGLQILMFEKSALEGDFNLIIYEELLSIIFQHSFFHLVAVESELLCH